MLLSGPWWIASVARISAILGSHLAARGKLRGVACRNCAEKVASLDVLLLNLLSHPSIRRLLLCHELLLLLSQLHGPLVVLEDRSIEVLFEIVSVLPVHDDAVLRLPNLLLRLDTHGESSRRLAYHVLEIASLRSSRILMIRLESTYSSCSAA